MSGSYKVGGLRDKYLVLKADGKPTDKQAKYFVLRLDEDPHARRAARDVILLGRSSVEDCARGRLVFRDCGTHVDVSAVAVSAMEKKRRLTWN